MIIYRLSRKYVKVLLGILIISPIVGLLSLFAIWLIDTSLSYEPGLRYFYFGSTLIVIFGLIFVVTLSLLIKAQFRFLEIASNRITYTKKFIFKSTQTLEAHQLEGVSIKQGPIGRIYDYGTLKLTGAGGMKVSTVPFDNIFELADMIRKINPKISVNTVNDSHQSVSPLGQNIADLESLSKLLEKGFISKEEFDAKKNKLLG